MYAPKVYGSHPEKTDPCIGMIDNAIEASESVEHIKNLLKLKAERIAKDEAEKAEERERTRIKLRPDEVDVVVDIALDLLNGHNPLKRLGIKPARGPRADPNRIQYEYDIATHFWALRLRDPKMNTKKALAVVSERWGITELRVRKIARARRAFVQGCISRNPHLDWLALASWSWLVTPVEAE